ncbi:DUF2842 domain-containing protein [Novosphingobium nitrogenifigens]|nr:DUF2842 domain-containing protein [Novosphingobium nitrogenifigens]
MPDFNPGDARPTWRKPIGVLTLVIALAIYVGVVAMLAGPLATWPVLAQMVAYIALGTIWILPLRRFMIWMETGRWG